MRTLKNKKGIFFTLIAISIVGVIVLLVKLSGEKNDTAGDEFRIVMLNNFLQSVQNNYLESVLNIAAHRAITSLTLYTLKTDSYLNNLNSQFSEVILTGEIDGVKIDSVTEEAIMEGNTLNDWILQIENIAKTTFGVELDIKVIGSAAISQSSPWLVSVQSDMSINLTDKTVSWNIAAKTIETQIDISDYLDPAFFVEFNGEYNHTFDRSEVPLDKWTYVALKEHIEQGTYVFWGDGKSPSFLMRFTNPDGKSKCCGIESLVDGVKLKNIGISGKRSSVDYQYVKNVGCPNPDLWEVRNAVISPEPIYLTSEHLGKYNIDLADAAEACPEGIP